LIPLIRERNPSGLIIGTSSLSSSELRAFPQPDYVIKKTWDEARPGLEKIFQERFKD